MPSSFDTVTIVGVGLLGASLGLALKRRKLAGRIIGIGRRQSSLDTAREIGAIDLPLLELSAEADSWEIHIAHSVTPASDIPRMSTGPG